jgi:hypothetical protein
MNEESEKKLSDDNPKSNRAVVLPPETQIGEHTESKPKSCRWCSSSLPISARVCPTCRGHQKWIWNYFSQMLLIVSTCISIVLVCISAANVYLTKRNLDEAKEKKIKAEEALSIAQSASKEALKAQAIASAAQSVLNDVSLMGDINTAAIGASYDIRALRKLWDMSHDTNDRVRVVAEKQLKPIISQLRADHEAVTSDFWGFKRAQNPQYYGFTNMEGWKRAEYVKNYPKVPDDRRVVYVTQFLSDEKETDEEKFVFCYSVLQLESRPEVIYALCAFIDAKAKLHKDYLFKTDYYLNWLKEKNAQRNVAPDRLRSR